MQSQVKTKAKLETQRSLNYLSNILSATSPLRDLIDQQAQQIASQHIQTIHKTIKDQQVNKQYICTQWNRHKISFQSYRSPYTNNYYPSIQQGNIYPSPILRSLQEKGNILFSQYSKLYYGQNGTISNFYVYQTQQGINAVFVLKKQYNDEDIQGIWSSTNFCQIRGDPTKSATYKLITSILYQLKIKTDQNNYVSISGSLRKNKADAKKPMQQYQIDEFHLMTVGKLVEQNQTLLRQQLESIFLAKSKEITFKNRYYESKSAQQTKIKMGKQFVNLLAEKQKLQNHKRQSSKIVQNI